MYPKSATRAPPAKRVNDYEVPMANGNALKGSALLTERMDYYARSLVGMRVPIALTFHEAMKACTTETHSTQKLEDHLGWSPVFSHEEGMRFYGEDLARRCGAH